MNISLTPELESAAKAKVTNGLSHNVSEALRKSLIQKQENQGLMRDAAIGYAQLQAGQTVEVKSEQHFIDLVRGGA